MYHRKMFYYKTVMVGLDTYQLLEHDRCSLEEETPRPCLHCGMPASIAEFKYTDTCEAIPKVWCDKCFRLVRKAELNAAGMREDPWTEVLDQAHFSSRCSD